MRKRICHNEHPMHPHLCFSDKVSAFSARKAKQFENCDDFLFVFLKNERETTPQYERMELRF